MYNFSIKTRLETAHDGLGYNEFSYQIYQAYDWYCLFKKYNCRFQVIRINFKGRAIL